MLVTCPDCKKQISDTSDRCIHCGYTGYPLRESKEKILAEIQQKLEAIRVCNMRIEKDPTDAFLDGTCKQKNKLEEEIEDLKMKL